jgi:hypothetical protein
MGTMAIFTPKPTANSAPAASRGSREREPEDSIPCSWRRSRVPVWANTSPMPTRTSIDPMEFCTRYFTPASRLEASWVW